jgi:hypothetical protein
MTFSPRPPTKLVYATPTLRVYRIDEAAFLQTRGYPLLRTWQERDGDVAFHFQLDASKALREFRDALTTVRAERARAGEHRSTSILPVKE